MSRRTAVKSSLHTFFQVRRLAHPSFSTIAQDKPEAPSQDPAPLCEDSRFRKLRPLDRKSSTYAAFSEVAEMLYRKGMETNVLRKRLNTYKSGQGKLTRVEDEVVLDVLRAWEQWQGSAADLYRALGLSKMQLVTMIQKGKRLVKKGAGAAGNFKEIKLSALAELPSEKIELIWEGGRTIRFCAVSQLLEFLDKVGKGDNV